MSLPALLLPLRAVSLALPAAIVGIVTMAGLAPAAEASRSVRLASAQTLDTDNDGSVDRLRARFSARVRGKPGPSHFRVKGYRVIAVDKPRGREVTLTLGERGNCDVGGKPLVRFGGRGLRDGRGRKLRRSSIDMERRDRGAPRVVCGVTGDADRDGQLDRITLTYSKRVRSAAQSRGSFLFTVAGQAIESVSGGRGRTLELRLREGSGAGTGATPAVTYRRPSRRSRYAVRGRGGRAFNGTFKATRDRIAPMLLAARTRDADADGLLDAVVTGWSEPVDVAGAAMSVAGAPATRASGEAPGVVALNLARETLDTGVRPAVTVGGPVRDGAGNHAARATAPSADGAPPVLRTARTADRRGAVGRLDGLDLTYSEVVRHPVDADGRSPFGVTGYGVAAAGAASGTKLSLTLREGPAPDTGARPPVGYGRGPGAPVLDPSGNEAVGQVLATTSDGVAPKLLSATTLDGDANGRLDRIRFTFSEAVTHAAKAGPGGFSASGLAGASALAANGPSVDLGLSEGGGADTGVRPGAFYRPTGAGDVADGTGNRAGAGTVLQAADGAPPVAVSAATADADADRRLDGIDMTMSEPVRHAQDTLAPFSFSAAGFTVNRVGEATGASLALHLDERSAPDTGSAPAVRYNGAGTKVLDQSGLQSPAREYAGLTRDALAPQLVSSRTADADADGRIDRVELAYSEDVTVSPGTSPFTVAGRTITSAAATGPTVALALQEQGHDSQATPAVSYTPGDLADLPEGSGDTNDQAAALDSQPTEDRAKPVIVAALTQDRDANGTIDRLRATFSEPVSHPEQAAGPFSLAVGGRTVSAVSGPSGAVLTADVVEQSRPDGGAKPAVSVTGASSIADLAAQPNRAATGSQGDTGDGVRPVLVSAQMGERAGQGCAAGAVNGRVDCMRATWSEPVKHDQNPSLEPGSGYLFDGGVGIPATSAADSAEVDVPLQEKSTPDRDKTSSVSYSEPAAVPVTDAADLAGLTKTVQADRACPDTADEDNETRASDNPVLAGGQVSTQRLCAADDDWFRVQVPLGAQRLKAAVRPAGALATTAELVGPDGAVLESSSATPPGSGHSVETGLGPVPGTYWLHVSVPSPQEGGYCVDTSVALDDEPSCGPNEGEVVFTEVGLDDSGGGRFVELKNVSDYPIDISQFRLERGAESCQITGSGGSVQLQPGAYAVGTASGTAGQFACAEISRLTAGDGNHVTAGDAGDNLRLEAGSGGGSSLIDEVQLKSAGVLDPALANGHSLEVKPGAERTDLNNDVDANWCRTWGAHTKGQPGDGCDEYRVNEVLFGPAPAGADGKAFVEIAGNIPTTAVDSRLLGAWVLTTTAGHSLENGQPVNAGAPEAMTLDESAGPDENGLYVVGDALTGGGTAVTGADASWSELEPSPGPRGVQLLRPNPPSDSCEGETLADAFGWSITGDGFSALADRVRSCAIVEGQPYTVGALGQSAARANLAAAGATQYKHDNDTQRNGGAGASGDFCPQGPPNPGALNLRPGC